MYYKTTGTGNAPCTYTGIAAPASSHDSRGRLPFVSRALRDVSQQMIVSTLTSHRQDTPAFVRCSARSCQNANGVPGHKTYASRAVSFGWVSLYRCTQTGIRHATWETPKCSRSAGLHHGTCLLPHNCSILVSDCRIFGACSYTDDRTTRRYWLRLLQSCLWR